MSPALLLLLANNAFASDLKFSYPTNLAAADKPSLTVHIPRATELLLVDCEVGSDTHSWDANNLAKGQSRTFTWERDPANPHAECMVQAQFSDGTDEGVVVAVDYTYGDPLKIDLAGASVDLTAHTLSVPVTAKVDKAEIVSWGVGKVELERREVQVNAGPGTITVPWVGDPNEVVILDVKLYGGMAWASFTYSPWFLNIPHEDVLFETNLAEITADEEWKMERTLAKLQEVVEKYGDLVPVKLYIAGCTDTVGDPGHNLTLSRDRARAIGRWLRNHGFTHPIYYHGFGESLLAVPTGDSVDSAANRRALYIVSSNPPAAGGDVPQVSWTAL